MEPIEWCRPSLVRLSAGGKSRKGDYAFITENGHFKSAHVTKVCGFAAGFSDMISDLMGDTIFASGVKS
jgi:hypothetical protein